MEFNERNRIVSQKKECRKEEDNLALVWGEITQSVLIKVIHVDIYSNVGACG